MSSAISINCSAPLLLSGGGCRRKVVAPFVEQEQIRRAAPIASTRFIAART